MAVGDTLAVTFTSGGVLDLEVQGVYRRGSLLLGEAMIDRSTLLTQVPASVDIAALVKLSGDGSSTAEAAAAVGAVAADYGVDGVLAPEEFVSTRSELLDGFQRVIQWMLLFTLLQALVGVVNTLLLSVGERRREFGLLRAPGASRQQLLRLVLIEGLSFAAVGTALGLVVGVLGAVGAVRALGRFGINSVDVPIPVAAGDRVRCDGRRRGGGRRARPLGLGGATARGSGRHGIVPAWCGSDAHREWWRPASTPRRSHESSKAFAGVGFAGCRRRPAVRTRRTDRRPRHPSTPRCRRHRPATRVSPSRRSAGPRCYPRRRPVLRCRPRRSRRRRHRRRPSRLRRLLRLRRLVRLRPLLQLRRPSQLRRLRLAVAPPAPAAPPARLRACSGCAALLRLRRPRALFAPAAAAATEPGVEPPVPSVPSKLEPPEPAAKPSVPGGRRRGVRGGAPPARPHPPRQPRTAGSARQRRWAGPRSAASAGPAAPGGPPVRTGTPGDERGTTRSRSSACRGGIHGRGHPHPARRERGAPRPATRREAQRCSCPLPARSTRASGSSTSPRAGPRG